MEELSDADFISQLKRYDATDDELACRRATMAVSVLTSPSACTKCDALAFFRVGGAAMCLSHANAEFVAGTKR